MKRKLLSKMLWFAASNHDGQYDRAGMPYILHPIRVMQLLNTDDEELQCIALGHDLIEDCGVEPLDLEDQGFTARIIHGIIALTKMPDEPAHLYRMRVKENPDAIRVKICDILHNTDMSRLSVMKPRDVERMGEYAAFYKELLDALKTETSAFPGTPSW